MSTTRSKLVDAEQKATVLFDKIAELGNIQPGKSEKELNEDIYALANEMFGVEKYWHKRIVRSGTKLYEALQPTLSCTQC